VSDRAEAIVVVAVYALPLLLCVAMVLRARWRTVLLASAILALVATFVWFLGVHRGP
jgi:hypothetical protein